MEKPIRGAVAFLTTWLTVDKARRSCVQILYRTILHVWVLTPKIRSLYLTLRSTAVVSFLTWKFGSKSNLTQRL